MESLPEYTKCWGTVERKFPLPFDYPQEINPQNIFFVVKVTPGVLVEGRHTGNYVVRSRCGNCKSINEPCNRDDPKCKYCKLHGYKCSYAKLPGLLRKPADTPDVPSSITTIYNVIRKEGSWPVVNDKDTVMKEQRPPEQLLVSNKRQLDESEESHKEKAKKKRKEEQVRAGSSRKAREAKESMTFVLLFASVKFVLTIEYQRETKYNMDED